MITKTSLLAIKALLELSSVNGDSVKGAAAIARKIRAPQNYLGKVLNRLAKQGIIISQKGLHGGCRLAREPKDITLYDVLDALEDVGQWNACLMTDHNCNDSKSCCMHSRWVSVRKAYVGFLKGTTLADVKKRQSLLKTRMSA